MAATLALVWLLSLLLLTKDLGKSRFKPKFNELFSKSARINQLSAALLFLFGARDIWFVIALPLYLSTHFHWSQTEVGAFLALWVIGYGAVQALAPLLTGRRGQGKGKGKGHQVDNRNQTSSHQHNIDANVPDANTALRWAVLLCSIPLLISAAMLYSPYPLWALIGGLLIFGAIFAVNSSLHSYLIVSVASRDGVSLDVGFYYMANAMGRLIGTLLSGWLYQAFGLQACLWVSSAFLFATVLITQLLTKSMRQPPPPQAN